MVVLLHLIMTLDCLAGVICKLILRSVNLLSQRRVLIIMATYTSNIISIVLLAKRMAANIQIVSSIAIAKLLSTQELADLVCAT